MSSTVSAFAYASGANHAARPPAPMPPRLAACAAAALGCFALSAAAGLRLADRLVGAPAPPFASPATRQAVQAVAIPAEPPDVSAASAPSDAAPGATPVPPFADLPVFEGATEAFSRAPAAASRGAASVSMAARRPRAAGTRVSPHQAVLALEAALAARDKPLAARRPAAAEPARLAAPRAAPFPGARRSESPALLALPGASAAVPAGAREAARLASLGGPASAPGRQGLNGATIGRRP